MCYKVNELYMTEFNSYLYSYLTNDTESFRENTITKYYEDERLISYSIVYTKNTFLNCFNKQTVFHTWNQFSRGNVKNMDCYIIKNIGNQKNRIHLNIEIIK